MGDEGLSEEAIQLPCRLDQFYEELFLVSRAADLSVAIVSRWSSTLYYSVEQCPMSTARPQPGRASRGTSFYRGGYVGK